MLHINPHNSTENRKVHIRKEKRKTILHDQIELLSRLYRAGKIEKTEIDPLLCNDITVWLMNNK